MKQLQKSTTTTNQMENQEKARFALKHAIRFSEWNGTLFSDTATSTVSRDLCEPLHLMAYQKWDRFHVYQVLSLFPPYRACTVKISFCATYSLSIKHANSGHFFLMSSMYTIVRTLFESTLATTFYWFCRIYYMILQACL